jgi:transglutaminase-like putative cysteine protease
LYLRGVVLDTYARGRWTASAAQSNVTAYHAHPGNNVLLFDPRTHEAPALSMTIRMRDAGQRDAPIFTAYRPSAVRGFSGECEFELRRDHWVLERTKRDNQPLRYEVLTSDLPIDPFLLGFPVEPVVEAAERGPARRTEPVIFTRPEEELAAAIWRSFRVHVRGEGVRSNRRGPRGDVSDWARASARRLLSVMFTEAQFDMRGRVSYPSEEVARVAREVMSRNDLLADPRARPRSDDLRAVRAFETFLRGEFAYTLSPPPVPIGADDPVAWFLTESKRGHCEYFASALAAMCRSVGIDARVVAGYMADDFDESAEEYVVRESDAHAWVEACVGLGLWQTFDGTPVGDAGFQASQPTGLTRWFTRVLDGIEAAWNTSIVGFDGSTQSRIFGLRAGEGFLQNSWLAKYVPGQRRRRMSNVTEIANMVIAAGAACVLTGLAWMLLRNMRRVRRQRVDGGWAFTSRWQRAQYRSIVRGAGQKKPAGVPLLVWIDSLPLHEPQRARLREQAGLLYASTFSGQTR